MKLDPITPNEDISVTRFRQYLRIETVQLVQGWRKFLSQHCNEKKNSKKILKFHQNSKIFKKCNKIIKYMFTQHE